MGIKDFNLPDKEAIDKLVWHFGRFVQSKAAKGCKCDKIRGML